MAKSPHWWQPPDSPHGWPTPASPWYWLTRLTSGPLASLVAHCLYTRRTRTNILLTLYSHGSNGPCTGRIRVYIYINIYGYIRYSKYIKYTNIYIIYQIYMMENWYIIKTEIFKMKSLMFYSYILVTFY